MTKGYLGYDKWSISHMGGQSYLAERIVNGNTESLNLHSHCLACAKSDIIAKRGGKVDTRGWHKQGTCGLFLLAMAGGKDE